MLQLGASRSTVPEPFSSCLYSSPEFSPPLRCCSRPQPSSRSFCGARAASGCPLPASSRPVPCCAPPFPPTLAHRSLCAPQLQNLESLRALLKGTEAELSMRVSEAARRQEDPLQRQRTLVEEERLRYLNDEELITQQLK